MFEMEGYETEGKSDTDESPLLENIHSSDSRHSEASSGYDNDDPMDEISYNGWGSDVYSTFESPESEGWVHNWNEGDSLHASLTEIRAQKIATVENVQPLVDFVEEALEENNNDPNNNMDSIEPYRMDEAAAMPFHHNSASDRSTEMNTLDFSYITRASSPQPGCSKDPEPYLPPMPHKLLNDRDDAMLKKSRYILGLVSKIHLDSIFEALSKDDKVPIEELKLWDLIPERERREYLDGNSRREKPSEISSSKCEKPSVSIENNEMQSELTVTSNDSTVTNNGAKRGPVDDICTVQPKKSSSDPDLSLNAIENSRNSLPRVASTPKITQLPGNPINRGAIPKVRDEKLKERPTTPVEKRNDVYAMLCEAKNAFSSDVGSKIMDHSTSVSTTRGATIPTQENPKPEKRSKMNEAQVVETPTTLDVKSSSSISVIKAPMLKYPTTKSSPSKPNIMDLDKAEPPAVGSARSVSPPVIHQKQMMDPSRQPGKLRLGASSASSPTAPHRFQRDRIKKHSSEQLPSQPKWSTHGRNHKHQWSFGNPGMNHQEMPPLLTMHSNQRGQNVASINQQRPTGIVMRPIHPLQTTATAVAAAPINQHGPTAMLCAPIPLRTLDFSEVKIEENLDLVAPKPMRIEALAKEQNTQRVICEEMYWKLRNIFPNVDRQYIKKLCPPVWGAGSKDAQMAPIIEHLLEGGESLPQEERHDEINEFAQNNVSYKSPDDLYEFFIGIFPDADPHYLRDFAVNNLGKDAAIKNFVDSNLERRDYPTREQYMARLKITEQQKQYTTGFAVKQYLSIIPDPSKRFLDPQRVCAHQTVAFEFLKSHFKKHRIVTISRAYTNHKYNLSLAAQSLESMPEELKSKRGGCEMPTEDLLLLQEIAFVKHKTDINNYIAQVKQREDEEFKALKEMNQLIECQCCFDSECVPSKCSECDKGHVFCNSCVITGTSAKMSEDQTRIYCFVNCGSEFSLSVLQKVLAPTTFSILLKKRQAAEVIEAGLDGLVSCPFCHFASIPPEGDKIFKCLNPECTKESCRLCKELSHVPLKCDEVTNTENARRYIEEKMTQALARKCYKCQRAYIKEQGCNKITCPCGAQMCYLCDKPITDYKHFRGQGSNDTTRCALYSDTIRLDAAVVRKVAEEAQREMLKRNPNITIDTTRLLPDIPQPTTGPHNNVLNADELPRRAQHVLDLPPL